jgi:ABC-type Mn2+/Zn2+ transport system permease subunit
VIEMLLFYRESILGALVLALGCSVLGVYVVLRRIVFVGAALAQLSSAGVGLAVFLASAGLGLGWLTEELTISLAVTMAGVAFFGYQAGRNRIPADAGLGVAFVVAGGASVLLVARSATADIYDLFFGGDILLISIEEIRVLVVVVASVLAVHALFFKQFLFVSYDPEMAATLGYRVVGWDLLLYMTFGIVITLAMQSVGVLLVFSYLVLPGVTGLLLGRRLRAVFAGSMVTATAGTLLGFVGSVLFDLPSGASIIVAMGVLAGAAWAFDGARRRTAPAA